MTFAWSRKSKWHNCFLLAIGLVLAGFPSRGNAAALTAKVKVSNGVPQILLNGKPVRARIFWGAPGATPVSVAVGAQQLSFEFTALQDEPQKATVHFRFGPTAGEIFLDDIRVVDTQTQREVLHSDFESGTNSFERDWTFWPVGEQNNVGTVRVEAGAGKDGSSGLHISQRAAPNGVWPDFHVYHHSNLALQKGHRYRVTLWAKVDTARDFNIAWYRPGSNYVFLGGPGGAFTSQIKLAATAGVNMVSFPVSLPWPTDEQPVDWAQVDGICESVLSANPNALLLPRIPMDAPGWWLQAHKDDALRWEEQTFPGATPRRSVATVASPLYRREAGKHLAALVAHLEAKFGDSVIGYHPCGQNTGEWFYEETWGNALNGYAPADLLAWRGWLARRYQSDAALRASWQQTDVTLSSVQVLAPSARHAAPFGILRDPQRERPLIDWAEFQQEMMADCVRDFARVTRQASGGRKLVLFFYGYGWEFAAVRTGPAVSGHYALRKVLDSPDIDVLCSPISYFDRGLGQSAPSMTAAESVALAGKMWLNEDDTFTHLASGKFPGWNVGAKNPGETYAMLSRNLAQVSLRNFGVWWMDLGATGWFNDAAMWNEMKRFQAVDDALLQRAQPFRPQVAAILDERSMLQVAPGGDAATRPGIYEARAALGRFGAPYGQYLLDDVIAGRVDAKMMLLFNAWSLSPTQRVALLKSLRGKTRLWSYAPGYIDGQQVSLAAMRELTGFALKPATPAKAWMTPTAAGRKWGLTQAFGVDRSLSPLFAVTDAKPDEILATYPDGSAAIALRRNRAGASLFVGAPALTSELLRALARESGVHLWTQTDCNVYANGSFLALHAAQEGAVQIDTGRTTPIHDAFSGQMLGRGPRLSLPMPLGSTRVLRF